MGRSKMCSSCRTRWRSALPASSSRHCKWPRSNSRRAGRPRTLPPTSSICALSHRPREAGTRSKSSRFSGSSGRRSSATRITDRPSVWRRFATRTSMSPAGLTTRTRTALPALDLLVGLFGSLGVDVDFPDVLCNVAYVLAYFGEDIAAATTLIDWALERKPSFASGWWRSGWIRLMNGQPELAIQHFEIGTRLNPRDILGFALGIGAGHFFARRFEEAKAALLLALEEGPGWVPPHRFLASCYAHLGRLDEAAEVVRLLRAMTPVVVPRATYWRNPEDRELFLSGLRLAAGEMA